MPVLGQFPLPVEVVPMALHLVGRQLEALGGILMGLGWFSNRLPVDPAVLADLKERCQDLGTYLLTTAAYSTFGEFGRVLFGVIVTLACLTTSVGLVTAVSEFFNDIFPRISYVTYAVICSLIGFLLANQGLSAVIDKSVPVLMVLYPVVMTILIIMLIETFVTPLPLQAQRLAVGLVMVVSILSVAARRRGSPDAEASAEDTCSTTPACFIDV